MLEVTSPVDLASCKSVMDSLISNMLEAGLHSTQDEVASASVEGQVLIVEQVRVTSSEGQLKVVYPSKVDLLLESITVIHQEKK